MRFLLKRNASMLSFIFLSLIKPVLNVALYYSLSFLFSMKLYIHMDITHERDTYSRDSHVNLCADVILTRAARVSLSRAGQLGRYIATSPPSIDKPRTWACTDCMHRLANCARTNRGGGSCSHTTRARAIVIN